MRKALSIIAVACIGVFSFVSATLAGVVGPELERVLQYSGPDDEVDAIIRFTGRVKVKSFKDKDKGRRRAKIIRALQNKGQQSRQPLLPFLKKIKSKRMKPLWIINGMAVTVRADIINELANQPGVDQVILDRKVRLANIEGVCFVSPTGWNLDAIRTPELWSLNYDGSSVVVATMDSGVDPGHPDITTRWRGGSNSWFDPNNEHPDIPYDANGHGTGVMGLIVGGDAGGSPIGVAPGAQWIAAKIFNDAGNATLSGIHSSFQWMLDPDGDPDTDDAPDIVNNSWFLEGTENQCVTEFQTDIDVLKAGEIAVVFAAGNSGPDSLTSVSPANDPQSFVVGSVEEFSGSISVAATSSRGPSACDGSIYPHIVAPGANVVSAELTSGNTYKCWSGTSFAAPHITGAMALLIGAMRDQGTEIAVSMLESAIKKSAVDLGDPGPDNDYGFGLLDVMVAYDWLVANVEPQKLGIFNSGTWNLDSNGNRALEPGIDTTFTFGKAGDMPVTGDWGGTVSSKVGVYRDGTWFLDLNGNGIWDGQPTDSKFKFGGLPSDMPVTGDWDGTGNTKVGVYRDGTWFLDLDGNGIWDGQPTDSKFNFGGLPGDIPVTGDWDGTGSTKVGVYRNGTWFLDLNGNGIWDGQPTDSKLNFGGLSSDIPVTGDWDGSGSTKIGVYRDGTWFLDLNGNGMWERQPTDAKYTFGSVGDTPVSLGSLSLLPL